MLKFLLLLLLPIMSFAGNDNNDGTPHDSLPIKNEQKKNLVYVEILGVAGYYSVNYKRNFFLNPKFAITGRLGYSYDLRRYSDITLGIFEVGGMNKFSDKHELFYGVGTTYIDYTKYHSENSLLPFLNAGYRHVTKQKLFWGGNLSMIMNINNIGHVYLVPFPWPGFQVGYCF